MSKFTTLNDDLHDYIVAHGTREDEALIRVREETAALGDISVMQIAPDQGALMTMLARMLGARRAIEVGTFTGYSAICIARALPTDGLLIACEMDPDRAQQASANFALAGVADRVDLRVGPAAETLAALPDDDEPFDLVFIDADKTGYDGYYERALELLRRGGLIILDNVLQDGRAVDPPVDDDSARAIAALNEKVRADDRVDMAMIPVADGITLALKR